MSPQFSFITLVLLSSPQAPFMRRWLRFVQQDFSSPSLLNASLKKQSACKGCTLEHVASMFIRSSRRYNDPRPEGIVRTRTFTRWAGPFVLSCMRVGRPVLVLVLRSVARHEVAPAGTCLGGGLASPEPPCRRKVKRARELYLVHPRARVAAYS